MKLKEELSETSTEQRNTQEESNGCANEDNGNKELFSKEDISKTPFTLVRSNETGEIAVMIGRFRINEKPFTDHKKAEAWAKKVDWEKMVQVLIVMIDNYAQIPEIRDNRCKDRRNIN